MKSFMTKIKHYLKQHGELVALLVIIVIATILFDDFSSYRNLTNVLRQVSFTGIISLGMTLVIISGGIDLSVGSVVSLGAVLAAAFSNNIITAITIPIIAGACIGLLNGLIVTKLKIVPFIGTLAMQLAVRGGVYIATNMKAVPMGDATYQLSMLGRGYLLKIPVPFWIFILVAIILSYVSRKTPYGRSLFAIGGNENASRMIGLKVDRNIVLTYMLQGMCAAISGLLLTGRMSAGQPSYGKGWEMDVIAAVAIGGTLLTGGVGSIGKTIIGALIFGLISNVINQQGTLNSYWQSIISGAILLSAIMLQKIAMNKRAKETSR